MILKQIVEWLIDQFLLQRCQNKRRKQIYMMLDGLYRLSQEQLGFLKSHCSYKNDPILKISSLLSQKWIDFYVGIAYGIWST